MSVEDRHPLYLAREKEWADCTACNEGQNAIKEAGTDYLPMPSGFRDNPDQKLGASLYEAYKERAQFEDIYSQTLRGMVGLIHRKEAVVEGLEGTPLEALHESCTRPDRYPQLTLMAYHKRITQELLHKGRVASLPDASSKGSQIPWFSLYTAEAVTNWAPDGSLFVLDESGLVRSPGDEFTWRESAKYRVLRLIDGVYTGQIYSSLDDIEPDTPDEIAEKSEGRRLSPDRGRGRATPGTPADVAPAVAGPRPGVTGPRPAEAMAAPTRGSGARGGIQASDEIYTPTLRGGKTIPFIPLVVGGAVRMEINPEPPPLAGVAQAAISMYQLNADYRHQLFMSGQETLYAVGVEQKYMPKVVGAGIIVGVPLGGTLSYASPSCTGIDAHAKAIDTERRRAVAAGVQLFDQGGSQQSGDALRIRYGAQTATLITVAVQSAAILEASLRNAAIMVGMSREDVERIIVKPNLEFLETIMSPQEANNLVQVWMSGAISYQTLYENLVRGGIESGERTADEEQELIDQETPDAPTPGAGGDLVPAPGTQIPAAAGEDEDVDPDGEGGPDSITDEELLSTFGSYASDVAAA